MVAGSRCSGRASTKRGDHGGQYHKRLPEQGPVDDGLFRAHPHDERPARRRRSERSSPEQMNHERLHRHDHHDHRREVDDEGVEVEADKRADQDIGGIADQGRRAADIGGEHFGEQERIGRDVELLGDRERHRHHQQHRRHVVEQRRYDGGGDLQQQKDAGGVRLRFLRRPDREIFEHPGAARDRHQDHHAGEQPDRVPVDALEGLVLVERPDDDHHRAPSSATIARLSLSQMMTP